MKLCKYYSLDECKDQELVLDELEILQADSIIEFYLFDKDDVIKIKNLGMNAKEVKDLLAFFRDNDVLEYPDYEELEEEMDDDYDEELDDDYDEEDEY
jgi:hypothetical protein